MISNARRRNRVVIAALCLGAAVFCLQETLADECPVGYKPTQKSFSSNSSACEPFNCTANISPLLNGCETKFPNSHCNPDSSRCECTSGFQLDEKRLQCVQTVSTNSTFCSSDLYCINQFGNAQCKENKCTCNLGYKWNIFFKRCSKDTKTKYILNFQKCTSFADCGENAFCDSMNSDGEGFCKCNFACTPTSNRKDCAPVDCSSDSDCTLNFQYSVCRNSECKCKPGYRMDTLFQTCKAIDWRKDCTQKSECGPNAVCFMGACKCNLGFVWDEDMQRCNSALCHYTSDCASFARTRCNQDIERCVCDYGFEVDPSDQKCTRSLVVDTTTTTPSSLSECTNNDQCNSTFVCNNNRCQCQVGMYYDPTKNVCRNFNSHPYPDFPDYHQHPSTSNVGMIVGCSVGGVFVLVIIITVLCCICKKRKPTPGRRVVHPRPPVQVHNVQPPVNITSNLTVPNVQPSAPTVTPPTARNTFQHPQHSQWSQYQVAAQPSYNPNYNAPPPSYSAATTDINSSNAIRVFPSSEPKSGDGIRVYPSLPKH